MIKNNETTTDQQQVDLIENNLDLIDNILSTYDDDPTVINKLTPPNEDTSLLVDTANNVVKLQQQSSSTPLQSPIVYKEIELVNQLFENGALNDASQQVVTVQNIKQEKISSLSPILSQPRTKASQLLHNTITNNLFLTNLKSRFNEIENESCENNENSNRISVGFTTARGTKLSIDKTALNKAENKDKLLCNQLKDEYPSKKSPIKESNYNIKTRSSNNSNKIKSLNRTENDVKSPTKNDQTISNRKSSINKTDIQIKKDDFTKPNGNGSLTVEFKTSTGKPIHVNQSILAKKQEDFETDNSIVENKCLIKTETQIKDVDSFKSNQKGSFTVEFKTSGGKAIQVNQTILSKKQEKFEFDAKDDEKPGLLSSENNIKNDRPLKSNTNGSFTVDFKTSGGKNIQVNQALLSKQQEKFISDAKTALTETENNLKNEKPNGSFIVEFKTSGGKAINVNQSVLNIKKEAFEMDMTDSEMLVPLKTENDASFKMNQNAPFIGFKTSSGKPINVNDEELNKAISKHEKEEGVSIDKSAFKPPQIAVKPPAPVKHTIQQQQQPMNRNYKKFKKPTIVAKVKEEDLKDNKENETKISENRLICHGKTLSSQERHEIETSINSLLLNETMTCESINEDEQKVEEIKPNQTEFESISNAYSFNIYNNNSNYEYLKLVDTIKIAENGFKLVKPVFKLQSLVNKQYIEKRKQAINEQQKRINDANKIIKQKVSVLLRNKEESKCMKNTSGLLKFSELNIKKLNKESTTYVTPNINELKKIFETNKFNLLDFYSIEYLNKFGCVKCDDGGCLIGDEEYCVGPNEFFNCLLDSNGVDRKFFDRNWFDNHFKWIVWKLYSYEQKFSHLFQSKVLTPKNVMLQLKYRYNIEIDKVKRSCVRKVTERDDTTSGKLIVLFVSRILSYSNKMLFVELCDGWYPIKALCDPNLTSLFESGNIIVGDKLAIFGCDLNGPSDGVPPLEAPEDLYLKLSINATRRAKWHSKLGFSMRQQPLTISLNSIKPTGYVGAINVIVERIYPLLYNEKRSDGSSSLHNEKQEQLFMDKYYTQCNKYVESVLNEINRDNKQQYSENEYPQKSNQLESMIKEKIKTNKQLSERNVTPVLKLRLSGVHKKDVDSKISCILTIWQNALDLNDQLIEGSQLQIVNLTASTPKTKYESDATINLNTTRQTRFNEIKSTNNQTIVQTNKRKNYDFIQLYKSQIENSYNEIDTCGIVVYLATNPYQDLVYLSNTFKTNSIITICFPKHFELFGFKDILKVGELIACLNLKFTNKRENNKYPTLIASVYSLFTQKLNRYKFIQSSFNQLQAFIAQSGTNKELCESSAKEISDAIANCSNSHQEFTNNNRAHKRYSLNIPNTTLTTTTNNNFDKSKVQSVAQVAELPPLIISKNPIKTPGLSYRQQSSSSLNKTISSTTNLNINNKYITKTVKRSFNENNEQEDVNKTYSTSSKYDSIDVDYDDSDTFSTQDLRDISNNESIMNSSAAKRAKL